MLAGSDTAKATGKNPGQLHNIRMEKKLESWKRLPADWI
jgi:hypothetical protein